MIDNIKSIYACIETFFVIYLTLYAVFLVLSVSIGALSLYEQKKRKSLYNFIEHDFYVPISILVPAYNEGVTIVDSVNSLLSLDYKLYEIIVIDDGSGDDTSLKLIEYFDLQQINRPIRKKIPCAQEEVVYITYAQKVPLTLIKKANGGKADALNMGINVAEYPYFICMDADSMLQHDALTNIARPVLEQDDVVACGGLVRIVNDVTVDDGKVVDYKLPSNLLLCMQVLEYDRTFLAARLLFDKFNGNLIISGAFGLFKKDVVISVGGYDRNTMGEDMELVVRLHAFCRAAKQNYLIKYAADAICWSQAPATLKDLKKQRRRWHIGLFQSIYTHRQMLFNPMYGMLSFISFAYFVIYELLTPYIEILGIISIGVAMFFNLINIPYMLLFFAIYSGFGAIMSLTAFFSRIHSMNIKLKTKDIFKAVAICMFENIGLRMILAITRLTAFKGYRKRKTTWGAITREKLSRPKEL